MTALDRKPCKKCGTSGWDKYGCLECQRHGNIMSRAKSYNAPGTHTILEWIELRHKYGDRCIGLGPHSGILTPDHIVPLSKRGSNAIDNIQPLCMGCNRRKRNRIIDFRESAIQGGGPRISQITNNGNVRVYPYNIKYQNTRIWKRTLAKVRRMSKESGKSICQIMEDIIVKYTADKEKKAIRNSKGAHS